MASLVRRGRVGVLMVPKLTLFLRDIRPGDVSRGEKDGRDRKSGPWRKGWRCEYGLASGRRLALKGFRGGNFYRGTGGTFRHGGSEKRSIVVALGRGPLS